MSHMSDFTEIQNLVKLFNPKGNEDNSDDDCIDNNTTLNVNKAERTQQYEKTKKINPYSKIEPKNKPENAIDELGEVDYCDIVPEAESDWKKTPKWNICYKQSVSAEDVFLQMGAKSPSTASCEDMVVTIELPGEHMQNMNINTLKERLEVTSPNFALNIPLPHPIDPQKGNAKWDKDKEELIITLRMDREFDFVNI